MIDDLKEGYYVKMKRRAEYCEEVGRHGPASGPITNDDDERIEYYFCLLLCIYVEQFYYNSYSCLFTDHNNLNIL